MPRQPIYLIIAVVAVVAAVALFFQRDRTGNAPSSSPAVSGSGANAPPTGRLDPAPSGTPPSTGPDSAPPSATTTAPSGEPARPVERR